VLGTLDHGARVELCQLGEHAACEFDDVASRERGRSTQHREQRRRQRRDVDPERAQVVGLRFGSRDLLRGGREVAGISKGCDSIAVLPRLAFSRS